MSQPYIDPNTGAIINEHIYTKNSNPAIRAVTVTTDCTPPELEGFTWKYSAFAFTTRANKYIQDGCKDFTLVENANQFIHGCKLRMKEYSV